MAFIVNWATDKAADYLKTGIQAGGTLAGNAVGGVGSLIENGGRSFGEGTVNGSIRGVGNSINGYGEQVKGSMAADGPVHATKSPVSKPALSKAVAAKPTPKALPGNKPVASKSVVTKPTVAQSSTSPTRATGGQSTASALAKSKTATPSVRTTAPAAAAKTPAATAKTPAATAKVPATKRTPAPLPPGKKRISPESRPRPMAKV